MQEYAAVVGYCCLEAGCVVNEWGYGCLCSDFDEAGGGKWDWGGSWECGGGETTSFFDRKDEKETVVGVMPVQNLPLGERQEPIHVLPLKSAS